MQTNARRNFPLKLALVALSGLLLQSVAPVHAQIQDRPKPGPEHAQMAAIVGDWKYEGVVMDSPLGPGGKFSGRETSRWTMDGLVLEIRAKDKGIYGGKEVTYEGLNVRWYDFGDKTWREHSYNNDGIVSSSVVTVNGSTVTSQGSGTDGKGKTTKFRSTNTLSADGKTSSWKTEASFDDGKTWMVYFKGTSKRVRK